MAEAYLPNPTKRIIELQRTKNTEYLKDVIDRSIPNNQTICTLRLNIENLTNEKAKEVLNHIPHDSDITMEIEYFYYDDYQLERMRKSE